MVAQNIIDKIWDAHVVCQEVGAPAVFAIDGMLIHEVTSAQAFDVLREKNIKIRCPEKFIATLDHSIPTTKERDIIHDPKARKQVEMLRQNAAEFGVKLYDFESQHQGVVHVMAPELGFIKPGMTIVCGDSHTSTHGAFGALAFGVGTTEVGHVLATNCILQSKPKSMKVIFSGKCPKHVGAKDMILKLIAEIGIGGAAGHIIEYCGEAVTSLSMEGRMTLCNMSIECGARAGLVTPDAVTYDYLKGKAYAPKEHQWDTAIKQWDTICSDAGCDYDAFVTIDVNGMKPMVSWGINPEQSIAIDAIIPTLKQLPKTHRQMAKKAYDYTGCTEGESLLEQAIQWGFVGSCTNGRIEDLREVAEVLRNRHVAKTVTLYIVPGSEAVRAEAISEGLDKIFEAAGAYFRMPGCSMCLGMNEDKVPAGEHCISTSNRNFMGRQGVGSITHLASPRTVALSAVAGKITATEVAREEV
jgi:3-isopropylmalate/(R)-2-methylmalate dehydratase large subunit